MRVLVLSDVHANLVALEAVLADAGAVDAIWSIGDTVGYGPRPRECLDRMVAFDVDPALAGNHDLACIGEVDLAEFNPVAEAAARWTAGELEDRHRRYLRALPSATLFAGVTLAHGSPRSPVWEYVTSAQVATENFGCFQTDVCIVGHSHVAMSAHLPEGERRARLAPLGDGDIIDLGSGRWIVNPGSVGQPRDRDPRAAYAILDTDAATFTARRVPYDVGTTQAQMTSAGLPEPLVARIAAGR